MDYISEIRELAQEGLRRDPMYKIFGANHHKWQFAEPVNKWTVRKFEDWILKEMSKSLNLQIPICKGVINNEYKGIKLYF